MGAAIMGERHFSPEHTERLRNIFTRLSDFIFYNKLEQIVSCGPSSTPYGRVVARAYKNRHGTSIKVVSLGHLGEELSRFQDGEGVDAKDILSKYRNFDFSKPVLLLDEVVGTGFRFNNLRTILARLNVLHKTATLLMHDRTGQYLSPHFVGEKIKENGQDEVFEKAVFLKRGNAFGLMWFGGKLKRPEREWLDKSRQVYSELREIADSVPKAKAKR